MTAKSNVKASATATVFDNGNADFWSNHQAADLIGGTVTSTETGINIAGGDIYNFEYISLDKANIRINKFVDEDGHCFIVTAHDPATDEEYLYDESSSTLTEAFDVLAGYAPVPQFLEAWNNSDLAQFGDPAEYFNNCMVITNFKWIDDERGIESVGQLAIYAHRHRPGPVYTSRDYFFSVYHTANGGGVNCEDKQFESFASLLRGLEKHSEIELILSHRD
jgi:hypothetical protein